MNLNRLYFIDAVRAFAILMMLQGHFIDTLLNPIYKDSSYTAYTIWAYFRGITAPTFFTISGLVFVYLLLKANAKGTDKPRIKKGLHRGLLLIVIGYALRIPFLDWLNGYFDSYFLVVDVLQCIGLSLLLLIAIYILTQKNNTILAVTLFILGFVCFVTEPLYRNLELKQIPLFFANYLTTSNGSVFTILPWFGYTAYGGFIATLFYKYGHKNNFRLVKIISFFTFGIFLIKFSSLALIAISQTLNIEVFKLSANYNYLFTRLGNVLLIFGVFYSFETYLKQSIITKIGEKTLSIYVIHFIIIYGSFTGIGLKRYFYHTLEPWQAIIGAILFMICVCFISFHYVKTNHFIYLLVRKIIRPLKK